MSYTGLVERLRAYRPHNEWGDEVHHVICDEAADAIEALTRPVERAIPLDEIDIYRIMKSAGRKRSDMAKAVAAALAAMETPHADG